MLGLGIGLLSSGPWDRLNKYCLGKVQITCVLGPGIG